MYRRRKWIAYEEGWRTPRSEKFCEGCQRTWPKKTRMYFVRGRWEYKRQKSRHFYIWLCPVCRRFWTEYLKVRGDISINDDKLPQFCVSLSRDARKPWWQMYPQPYIRLEAKYGLEVIDAGLDPAFILIEKVGCHAKGTIA